MHDNVFLSGISKYAPDKIIEGNFCVCQKPADFCRPDKKGVKKNAVKYYCNANTICENR